MKERPFGGKSSVKSMVKMMGGGILVRKLGWQMFGTLKAKGVQRDVDDRVIWTVARCGTFSIKSLYSILEPKDSLLFPCGSIWRSSVPPKVAFFAWEASWEKVLTLDQLQRKGHY
ncbi:hypothetical protein CK203_034738 [Vitis vinifera]|uniref:Reverse transcriptase zinc-binding domain-containing protein n=1 Tax=Vitis vinifera TaxID=29760 RepID=A0A438HWE4_VITVI|nr:hypothetical protein CK203_034738 [Vitis vinifera]